MLESLVESRGLRKGLEAAEKTIKADENNEPRGRDLKLNVISGKTIGMTRERSNTMSVI